MPLLTSFSKHEKFLVLSLLKEEALPTPVLSIIGNSRKEEINRKRN